MRSPAQNGSSEYLKLLGTERFHYRSWHGSSHNRVLLLHGLGECADVWSLFASSLIDADIIAMDLRGHGGTPSNPNRKFGIDNFIADLRLQIDYWARKCVVIGSGLGARLAAEAAITCPDFVRAVVLFDVSTGYAQGDTLVEILQKSYLDGQSARQSDFSAETRNQIYHQLTWARPGGMRVPKCDGVLLEGIGENQIMPLVEKVSQPTLIISGDDGDPSNKRDATRMAQLMPNGNAKVMAGGRWPHIEYPVQAASAVAEFLCLVGHGNQEG